MLISELWPHASSGSQILRGCDNARSFVRQESINPCPLQPADPLSHGRGTPETYRRRDHGILLRCLEPSRGDHAPELIVEPMLLGVAPKRTFPSGRARFLHQSHRRWQSRLRSSFFKRQRRCAARFCKLKRGNPDVCVDNDDQPLDRALRRRGFSARASLMSRGTSASV
jgi:hypothetical protein